MVGSRHSGRFRNRHLVIVGLIRIRTFKPWWEGNFGREQVIFLGEGQAIILVVLGDIRGTFKPWWRWDLGIGQVVVLVVVALVWWDLGVGQVVVLGLVALGGAR